MFKMFKPTFLVVPIAWATILIIMGVERVTPFLVGLGVAPKVSWTVLIVQAVVTVVIITPLWRGLWRIAPKLNHYIYPDLTGYWDVEGETNWDRLDAVLKAANGEAPPIDMRRGDEAGLPPLGKFKMEARITQSWLSMSVELWNPAGAGPIDQSETLMVEPFRGKNGRHGLTYVFEQTNRTDVVSDDSKFRGAAWLVRDRENPDVLCGRMWSDRMWRRGMNTAADLRFTRSKAKKQRGNKARGS